VLTYSKTKRKGNLRKISLLLTSSALTLVGIPPYQYDASRLTVVAWVCTTPKTGGINKKIDGFSFQRLYLSKLKIFWNSPIGTFPKLRASMIALDLYFLNKSKKFKKFLTLFRVWIQGQIIAVRRKLFV